MLLPLVLPLQQLALLFSRLLFSRLLFDFLDEVKEIAPELQVLGIVITKADTRKAYFKQTLET